MRRELDQVIARLQEVRTLDALQALIVDLRGHFGVEHIVYHSVSGAGQQYAVLTYTSEWVDRYVAQDYSRIDPVVLGCFSRFHPVDWKDLDWTGKAVRAFLREALSYGVGNQGFSVPIRGPSGQFALFTVNHCCSDADWAGFIAEHLRDVILIAHFLNQKALEIERGTDRLPLRPLSPREADVLTLLAMGYSRARAAESLAISEHTLRAYVESARAKLGASNTTHAVACAISRGLVVV